MLIKIIGGFLMALADSVPGVSGGTIAFIMGIYDDFINSLNNIVSKDKEKRKSALKFLAIMGSGWIVGMASAAIVITSIFEENIYEISSLFMGFILFAIPLVIKEEMEAFKENYKCAIHLLTGILLVAGTTYLSGVISGGNRSLAFGEFGIVSGIVLFICGVCAISAMVLPGVSGSTLMVVFGFYQAIMTAISGFLHMEFKYVVGLMIFGFGCLTGIATSVKGLKVLLEKYRSAMMYLIVGMMVGSFYAIIMGPTNLDEPVAPLSLDTFSLLFFVIGGVVIYGIQGLKKVLNKDA